MCVFLCACVKKRTRFGGGGVLWVGASLCVGVSLLLSKVLSLALLGAAAPAPATPKRECACLFFVGK